MYPNLEMTREDFIDKAFPKLVKNHEGKHECIPPKLDLRVDQVILAGVRYKIELKKDIVVLKYVNIEKPKNDFIENIEE